GWMARTTDSVYYPLIAHWWLGLATDIFCLLRAPEKSAAPQAPKPRPAMALPVAKRVPPFRAQPRKKKKAVSKAAK
ncbi:MAG: hypothetical protein AB1405_01760, partial [Bdellovibrionota bacterium]